MANSAGLLAALAPGARFGLPLALASEQRLRQDGPGRTELLKLGSQLLGARCQYRPLVLQVPHLGAQPGVVLAQRRDQVGGPYGCRAQPINALAQPPDRALPGFHHSPGRRAPAVELPAQRRVLVAVPVRRPHERPAKPGDILVQPVDLVPVPGLDPLLVLVGSPQRNAKIGDLVIQKLEPALKPLRRRRPQLLLQPGVLLPQQRDRPPLGGFRNQRPQPRDFRLQGKRAPCRAADFLRLFDGRLQLGPALVELPLQGTRPGAGSHLRPAQLFTARFGHVRPRSFPLRPGVRMFVQRLPVDRLECRRRQGRRRGHGATVGQRQTRANVLVENRHAPDGSAWRESLPAENQKAPPLIPRIPNSYSVRSGRGRAIPGSSSRSNRGPTGGW